MVRLGEMGEQGGTTFRRAVILSNPAARRARKRFDGGRAVKWLAARGFDATLEVPGSREDMGRLARAAATNGIDFVFVVGGDGSLRAAASGLAGSTTALAAIPAGTADVWAREAGIPRSIGRAFATHVAGQTVRMDIGRANGEAFLLMVSVGWDAEIASRVSGAAKDRLGELAYIIEAAKSLPV